MRVDSRFLKAMFTAPVFWSGLVLSVMLHLLVAQMLENKGKVHFEYHTNSARDAIENRMRAYMDVLHGAHSLFASLDQVTRAQFHDYVKALDLEKNFPGVLSIGFTQLVSAEQKSAFEAGLRKDASVNGRGYPDFAIKPAGGRDAYQVLTYVEPENAHWASLGLDLAANESTKAALDLARDSGQIAMSGRLVRMEGNARVGIAVRMPLYRRGMATGTLAERRAAYYGSVGAKLDIDKLMFGTVDYNTLTHLSIRLYDVGFANGQHRLAAAPAAERLLFNKSHPDDGPLDAKASERAGFFVKKVTMTLGQRAWEAEFSAPRSALLNRFESYLPWAVLLVGLGATILFCGLSYSLATARRRALEMASDMTRELRASEASLEEAQLMARLGSWTLEPGSGKMTWSTETYRILGFHAFPDAPQYDDFLRRIFKQDRQQVGEGLDRSMLTGQEFRIEHRITQQDGTVCWVHTIARVGHDGQSRLLRGTIMDITERKRTVDALKRSQELLRELTAYQERIREEERKRIAREIHDELGQTLLALRIDVSMLDARTVRSHPRLNERVRLALQHLDATVKTVRGIINNLRPAALDLGLNAAIEWQVAEFRRRTGIACELLMIDREFAVDEARATSLFRILQESLTNVIRHAKATQVIVELYQERARLVMKISDNGIGLRPGPHAGTSFGLVGMEERVHALNGEFLISSTPGKGTVITVHIPLHAADAGRSAGERDDCADGQEPHPQDYCL